MEKEILKSIIRKTDSGDLVDILARRLSSTELNSLMMEVFRLKCQGMTPCELMKSYEVNKYTKPAFDDPIKLKGLELGLLRAAEGFSFTPVELSPVAPLGACSVVGTVNQNKIISAIRGTEVSADATNSLALHICSQKRKMKSTGLQDEGGILKYCTTHRLIRTQIFDNPRFTPHFSLFCMVTSGRDRGSLAFEKENLLEHISFYRRILKDLVNIDSFKLKLFKMGSDEVQSNIYTRLVDYIKENLGNSVDIHTDMDRLGNNYYRGIQFKIYINLGGQEAEVGDGGFVDWSQKLLENRKERMIISAIGTAPLLSLL